MKKNCHVKLGSIIAGLIFTVNVNATENYNNNLVMPGDFSVSGSLTMNALNYEIVGPTTVTKLNGQTESSKSLDVRASDGICFLSGWNSNGNASSSGYVSYDASIESWKVTVAGHDGVKATAICMKWKIS